MTRRTECRVRPVPEVSVLFFVSIPNDSTALYRHRHSFAHAHGRLARVSGTSTGVSGVPRSSSLGVELVLYTNFDTSLDGLTTARLPLQERRSSLSRHEVALDCKHEPMLSLRVKTGTYLSPPGGTFIQGRWPLCEPSIQQLYYMLD